MNRVIGAVTLALLVTAGAAPSSAQRGVETVVVNGVVRDASGGALQDATVQAIVAGRPTGSAATDAAGRYSLNVPAGVPFQLRVRREGFAEEIVDVPGRSAPLAHDVSLALGRLSDTVVVTAARAPESLARVTESVSVITSTDIEALGAVSLADVVRGVPGLNVESAGREGALTAVFSRGGESDYNLVLVDGVRVNQSGGSFDFSRIDSGAIERVEVVRGAQSALYGSDAMGSVIQVFTRRPGAAAGSAVTGSIETGSFNTWRGDARASGGAGDRIDYHVGGAARRSDGAFGDVLAEEDRFNEVALDGGLGFAAGRRVGVRAKLRSSRADGRAVGQTAYGPGDLGTAYDTRDFSWNVEVAHSLGERVSATATGGYYWYRGLSEDTIADETYDVLAVLSGAPGALFPRSPRLERLVTPSEFNALRAPGALPAGEFLASTPFGISDFPFVSETELRRPAFKYQADYAWGAGQRLSAGYEFEREDGRQLHDPVTDFRIDNHAYFIQQRFSVSDRWFATVGGRLDDKSRYGQFFSPKLSVGGFVVPHRSGALSSAKVFFNAGKGIKAPQFSELLGGSTFFDGNPDLRAERARTLDVGVEVTFAGGRIRTAGTFFDNHFRDQVEFRASGFGADGIPDFYNVAGSDARGWELEAALQQPLHGFTASAAYTLLDTEVVETENLGAQFQPGQPLLRRPKHSAFLRGSYAAGRVAIHIDAEVRGERHDSSFLFLSAVPSGETVDITVNPGYVIAGLGVDVRATDTATLFVRGDNIGGTDYESELGYPGLPRAFVVGLRFRVGR